MIEPGILTETDPLTFDNSDSQLCDSCDMPSWLPNSCTVHSSRSRILLPFTATHGHEGFKDGNVDNGPSINWLSSHTLKTESIPVKVADVCGGTEDLVNTTFSHREWRSARCWTGAGTRRGNL
jgi:hypothetical protein